LFVTTTVASSASGCEVERAHVVQEAHVAHQEYYRLA
jgi:hypothetical protein